MTIQGNGIEQADDDGGNNYDARLALELEPGVYTVTAAATDSSGGAYKLTVR